MRKTIAFITAICLMLPSFSACAFDGKEQPRYLEDENVYPRVSKLIFNISEDEANINLNKVKIVPPFIDENNSALVPLRVLCEGLGAEVLWKSSENSVEIKDENTDISVGFDKASININGEENSIPSVPQITENTAMVPIRAISEALGAEVRFDAEKNRVIVSKRSAGSMWQVNTEMLDEIKEFVLKKTAENSAAYEGKIPHATDRSGKYKLMDNPGWVAGFYTGLNYLCYDWSGDTQYIDYAKEVFKMLKFYLYAKPQSYHHDLGFTFTLSYYKDYLLNNTEESKKVVIDAADVLMKRVTDKGYIQGWNMWGEPGDEFSDNNKYRMICDSMCNIPILFIATELTGDKKYYDAAVSQADLTMEYLVRDDFTTTHTFVFAPDGTPRFEQQYQGAYDSSCWSRGHAWVINGMAQAYKFTGDERYLQSAKDLADTYLLMSDEDLIPRWDFVFKGNEKHPRDTSAASIIACGLWDIYDVTGDEFYKDTAYKILCELYENYSTVNDPDNQGLILHATGNMPQHQNIDISLIYGDYYFAQLTDRFSSPEKY